MYPKVSKILFKLGRKCSGVDDQFHHLRSLQLWVLYYMQSFRTRSTRTVTVAATTTSFVAAITTILHLLSKDRFHRGHSTGK